MIYHVGRTEANAGMLTEELKSPLAGTMLNAVTPDYLHAMDNTRLICFCLVTVNLGADQGN